MKIQPICTGIRCPSKKNCQRHKTIAENATYAALWARREAGDSACDMYQPIKVVSTFATDKKGGA